MCYVIDASLSLSLSISLSLYIYILSLLLLLFKRGVAASLVSSFSGARHDTVTNTTNAYDARTNSNDINNDIYIYIHI